ncbi:MULTISPECIES: type II toxin-antitoxin system RelE/ParE family toxin [Yersinia]|uniref:type II toxin-antitoxin system RelE/ParE family toxin n=1 Tax=Yersinia TaxID=629 RepID=UPI00119F2655|nr:MULTISPECIES: type II toxin-antitoxin system RelE/ParE family toxin [Yersinia]MBS0056950.1 type II toxin-antitoxin system RelE/ParE family toxin [Yersinia sp. Marseille-Q3913]
MKSIKLTPKANEDLEAIWLYSYEQFGLMKADNYIGRLSDIFDVLATHDIGVPRPELGENICSQPIEQHLVFFISTASVITIIRILNQSQDAIRHLL